MLEPAQSAANSPDVVNVPKTPGAPAIPDAPNAPTAPGAQAAGARPPRQRFSDDPLWYKDAVIYELHVKSFFDANNDGIGDFPGLIQRLDYIAELGVNTIWLLPFYPSPRRDDGYDISDYRGVHPDYGAMADVRQFISAAHERGLRVVIELVINHTSDQHPWFQRARRAKPGSAARNFYVWSDTDTRYAGTRVIFLDTEKSNWAWDPVANAYYWHRFYANQPELNYDNPQVLRAMLAVLRYWARLGVDGFRLDAVPYLVEREGTSNENLPETHAVLKRIRAALDATFPGRMLLAEANQWPEDVQQYFGDGDECHMAFHFPLMPRMFMALAQEDRFPITDILRQTPDIPANCQWALFLRNHDELTLEMVTDRERDYLWKEYASDRRARLNLGIRRRLAPLMQRDRRRIELLNSLLLSMPGAPVIYYGDEIGMGDNFHLGDRDGVRTPMQWSPDRNGSFSRADPASLVLPPIMDPLYGYQAVNVEAQARDPHSLLNWMRRMLGIRQQQKVFGRGTLRLLSPTNRRILAYLREYVDGDSSDTLLCVANLSRSAQAVELDLNAFVGRVPVEMLGGSAFPPIGLLPYLLTLPPYGFYWFLLATQARMPAWHTPAPEPLPEYNTFVVRRSLDELLADPARRILEQEVLPAYLPKRRWFGAKDEKIERARIADVITLPALAPPVLLVQIEVHTRRGEERYLLPFGFISEDAVSTALPQQLALARVRRGGRVGFLTDAFALDSFARRLLEMLSSTTQVSTASGTLRFLPTSRLAALTIAADAEVRRTNLEQSNSSVIVGQQAIIKLLRRVHRGPHPEAEMGRYLTEHGFNNIPALLGEITQVAADGTPTVLAVVQAFAFNQGDAWSWSQNTLERAVQTVIALPEGVPLDEQVDVIHQFSTAATVLGRRLGEMHMVLAQPSEDPAFAPRAAGEADCEAWAAAAGAQLQAALAALASERDWADDAQRQAAATLVAQREGLLQLLPALARAGLGSLCMRIHGDLHLGQVLVVSGDAYFIDFEGEPARPLAERRAKSSPLRDVAGMLRSLDYMAASGAASGGAGQSAAAQARKQAIVTRFHQVSESAFMAAYAQATRPLSHHWSAPDSARTLLDLFLLDKAAYEVNYESANRPAWLPVPLMGLAALAARLLPPRSKP
ncbi:MAG TPA: maltose alpha-D-glucosyltransferase [Steroidobacteraceae bacterium]|jgi:maltose alpha-D-glucosyltransferase/alpha-amylase|nr:maltose alpha-D-glucosyltransferase [Steroidobacteraceae bacterium]